MITTDNIETLKNAITEIERLNAQVAMLRETLSNLKSEAWLTSVKQLMYQGNLVVRRANDAITETESDWLTAHDAKVRDDALEDAAKVFEKQPVQYWQTAATLRAMKGKS